MDNPVNPPHGRVIAQMALDIYLKYTHFNEKDSVDAAQEIWDRAHGTFVEDEETDGDEEEEEEQYRSQSDDNNLVESPPMSTFAKLVIAIIVAILIMSAIIVIQHITIEKPKVQQNKLEPTNLVVHSYKP